MAYGDIRDTTLKLINQYTRIGNKINLTYNEQDDVVTGFGKQQQMCDSVLHTRILIIS